LGRRNRVAESSRALSTRRRRRRPAHCRELVTFAELCPLDEAIPELAKHKRPSASTRVGQGVGHVLPNYSRPQRDSKAKVQGGNGQHRAALDRWTTPSTRQMAT